MTDRYYTFDADQIPDGPYQIRVVASDAPSHNPGEALTGERTSERFVLDTASPTVNNLIAHLEGGKLHITAEAKDPRPRRSRAPSIPSTRIRGSTSSPPARLSDAETERYDFSAPLPQQSEQLRVAKLPPAIPTSTLSTSSAPVFDRYDNSATAKTVVR